MMGRWAAVRSQFRLRPDWAFFASMVFASHPLDVRRAVRAYSGLLDRDGFARYPRLARDRRKAALEGLQRYFDVKVGCGALTHSTTVGLGQVIAGLKMREDQEILTSSVEHPAAVETIQFRTDRHGSRWRAFDLVKPGQAVRADVIVNNVSAAIHASTRALVLAWVYSSDGLKLPIARIAEVVRSANSQRSEDDRLILVVDGVHGFGHEDTTFPELGCDFLVAGLHKTFCGPRGTAVICGTDIGWNAVVPLASPLSGANDGPADRHWPGGIRNFDHWWAVADAFDLHLDVLGKSAVASRVANLAGSFKRRAARLPKVRVVTPIKRELSSGIVCLDVDGYDAADVVNELRAAGVVATESAPDHRLGRTHVRFGVSFLNRPADIARACRALSVL
jgi:isopenicillin-N epimerase